MSRFIAFVRRFVLLISLLISVFPAMAEETKTASLIIVGPGDPLYTYWGHIGIAINDRSRDQDIFYDFGNFSFYSDNFYTDFAMGRMLYLGMETPTEWFLSYSLLEDRDLIVYPLNLTPQEVEILDARLQWWVEPENREYLYDYFRDNCSTIIRDVIDEAVGGALAAETKGVDIGRDFRHFARTGAHESKASEIMLHYLLGPLQDTEIDEWDLMFLPEAVPEILSERRFVTEDGSRRALISDPIILRESTRQPVPEEPRPLWPLMFIAGTALSALWIGLRKREHKTKRGRITGNGVRVLIIIFIGLPGLVLGFMMAFTDHVSTSSNLNLWPSLPTILLALIPLIKSVGSTGAERDRFEFVTAAFITLNFAAWLVCVLIRLTGLSTQDAYAFWAFYGPLLSSASLPGLLIQRRIERSKKS